MALKNKQLLLVGIETTYGTPATLVGANAVQTGDINITPLAGDTVQRNIIKPFFGNSQSMMVTSYVTIDFEVELGCSATVGTAPQFNALLRACGFTQLLPADSGGTAGSVIYLPHTLSSVTEGGTSATIFFQRDGIKHTLTGARGTVSFDLTVKQLPKMKFTMTGLFGAITDSELSLVAGVNYTHKQPLAVSSANTSAISIHGYTPMMESFTFDMANDVKYRALVGGAGSETVIISDRKPKGNIKIEAPALEAGAAGTFKNFFTIAKNSELGNFSITHGTETGNKIKFEAATNGLGIEAPKYGDNEGVVMLDMGLTFIPTAAGNDEIKITFS